MKEIFVKDMKVVTSEECTTQHKPLVSDFKIKKWKTPRERLHPGEIYGNYMKTGLGVISTCVS